MSRYPRLRSDLVVARSETDDQVSFTIKDPVTGNYFRLREPEYWLIRQLDGVTPPEEVARRFAGKFGLEIDADAVIKFVAALEKLYFLDDGRSEQATSRASYAAARGQSLFGRLLFIKLKGFDPSRILPLLVRLYRPLHNRFFLGLSFAFIVFAIGIYTANFESLMPAREALFQTESIVLIIVTIFLTVAIHEFGHAVTCRFYGGEVREIGFLLLFFQPCLYADISDAWLLSRKSQRMAVTWAGPFIQFLTFAAAVLVWRVTVPGTAVSDLAVIVTVVSGVSVLFNFNPLIKLDGYYLLSDWVEIPNLRRKAFSYLGNWLKRTILAWPVPPQQVTVRQKRIFLSYALASLGFSAALLGFVLFLVAKFLLAKMAGWGLLLLFVVILYAARANVAAFGHGMIQHVRYMRQSPARLIAWLVAIASIIIGLFAVPFPHRVGGEVSVRPIREFNLRLNEFGLLERTLHLRGEEAETRTGYLQMTSTDMAALDLVPLVSDGEAVAKDDTLALLLSNQLTTQLMASMALLEKYESELELLRSPPKPEEVAEAEAQVAASRATVEQRRREFDRVRELKERNLATSEEYEEAESALEIAEAELQNKRARLRLLNAPPKPEEEAVIRAQVDQQRATVEFLKTQEEAQSILSPIPGTIRVHNYDDRILSVVDNSTIQVLVPVSDFDIELIQPDQPVSLKVRSYPNRIFEGIVTHIPVGAEERGGRAYFIVSVTVPNADHALQSGMTGYGKIHIGHASLARLLAREIAGFVRVEFWSWW